MAPPYTRHTIDRCHRTSARDSRRRECGYKMEGIPRERGVQGKLDPVALIGVASRLRDEANRDRSIRRTCVSRVRPIRRRFSGMRDNGEGAPRAARKHSSDARRSERCFGVRVASRRAFVAERFFGPLDGGRRNWLFAVMKRRIRYLAGVPLYLHVACVSSHALLRATACSGERARADSRSKPPAAGTGSPRCGRSATSSSGSARRLAQCHFRRCSLRASPAQEAPGYGAAR
jgi:hypothetical protein